MAGRLAKGSGSTTWLGMMSRVRSNQKLESWVSTSPLPGIGVGRITSNAEMRSVATITRVSSPSAYTSRTLPRLTSSRSVSFVS